MTLSYPKGIYLIIVYIAIHRSVWVGPRSFYTCNSTMFLLHTTIKPHFSARRDGATKRIVLRGSTQVFQLQLSTWKPGLFFNIGQCVKLCKLLAHNGHAMTCPFRNKQSLYYVIYTCRILYRGQMSIICFWLDLPQSTSHCQHNKN